MNELLYGLVIDESYLYLDIATLLWNLDTDGTSLYSFSLPGYTLGVL